MPMLTGDDPFLASVDRINKAMNIPGRPGASAKSSASKPTALGGSQVLTEPGQKNYLGKETGGINLVGTQGTDIISGPPAVPSAPGGGAGAGGPFGGGGGGARAAGDATLARLGSALGLGAEGVGLLQRIFAGDLGVRGNVGGPGQIQRSDQSLSDRIRSGAVGSNAADLSAAGLDFSKMLGGPNQTLSVAGPSSQMSAFDVFRENLPPGGGAVQDFSGLAAPIAEYFASPQGVAALGELGINTDLGAAGAGGAAGSIPYLAIVKALFDIGLTAAGPGSDEDKAKQAATQAIKAAGAIAAPYTFGASLAVTQILDFLNNMDRGMSADEALVRANDPTAALDFGGGGGLSGLLYAPSKAWQNFIPNLYGAAGQQGKAFQTLAQALPYVKSKQELGALINTMKNYVSTTTGIPGGAFSGGYEDPYRIATIPGIGPVTHGQQTQSVDWAGPTQELQRQIDALLGVLPGERITAQYGQPGGGLEGEPAVRLWSQFVGSDFAPFYLPNNYSTVVPMYGTVDEGGQQGLIGQEQVDVPKGFYDRSYTQRFPDAGFIGYGEPGYDYAASGFPDPAGFQVSPYWQQLVANQQADAQQRSSIAQRALSSLGGSGGGSTPGVFGPTGGVSAPMLDDDERRRRAAA